MLGLQLFQAENLRRFVPQSALENNISRTQKSMKILSIEYPLSVFFIKFER